MCLPLIHSGWGIVHSCVYSILGSFYCKHTVVMTCRQEAQWKGNAVFLLNTPLHCERNIKSKAKSVSEKKRGCVMYAKGKIHHGVDETEVQDATINCSETFKIPL